MGRQQATDPPVGSSQAGDFDRIVVEDVSRHYGRRRALSRISLELQRGDVMVLIGPNGAGKSTLLGLLATVIAASSGVVRYGGRTAAVAGIALRRRIGYLSHELQLYSALTARENLMFFGALYGLRDPAACAEAALQRAGLAERGNDLVAGFSRGMRQRLAIERALLHGPRLVLLDEPYTGLDEAAATALTARIGVLRAEQRILVLATHDLEVIEGLVDDAVVLQQGCMTRLGAGQGSLRDRYRALVTAG